MTESTLQLVLLTMIWSIQIADAGVATKNEYVEARGASVKASKEDLIKTLQGMDAQIAILKARLDEFVTSGRRVGVTRHRQSSEASNSIGDGLLMNEVTIPETTTALAEIATHNISNTAMDAYINSLFVQRASKASPMSQFEVAVAGKKYKKLQKEGVKICQGDDKGKSRAHISGNIVINIDKSCQKDNVKDTCPACLPVAYAHGNCKSACSKGWFGGLFSKKTQAQVDKTCGECKNYQIEEICQAEKVVVGDVQIQIPSEAKTALDCETRLAPKPEPEQTPVTAVEAKKKTAATQQQKTDLELFNEKFECAIDPATSKNAWEDCCSKLGGWQDKRYQECLAECPKLNLGLECKPPKEYCVGQGYVWCACTEIWRTYRQKGPAHTYFSCKDSVFIGCGRSDGPPMLGAATHQETVIQALRDPDKNLPNSLGLYGLKAGHPGREQAVSLFEDSLKDILRGPLDSHILLAMDSNNVTFGFPGMLTDGVADIVGENGMVWQPKKKVITDSRRDDQKEDGGNAPTILWGVADPEGLLGKVFRFPSGQRCGKWCDVTKTSDLDKSSNEDAMQYYKGDNTPACTNSKIKMYDEPPN